MSRAKRFTKDEIDVLSKSPYVKNIRENRLSFTYEFRCILYDEWIKYPSVAQIRKVLTLHNFNCTIIGCDVINRLHRNFKRDGRPTGGKNKALGIRNSLVEKYDNEFLISSGIFKRFGKRIRFTSEFIDKVYKEYPEVSIETQLKSYGLAPKRVGYQRIYMLKKVLEGVNPRDEKIDSDIVTKYIHHPYVQRCTSKHFVLNNSFYNQASSFKDFPIDEVLGIFEINGSDLPVGVRNRIQYKLNKWNIESLSVSEEVDLDFKFRVQYNKMRALEKMSLMHFNRLRDNLPQYTFEQKKTLCIWIKELPHDRYDYSIQSILKKLGLSRSSYYSILSNENYGMKDKQDEIDFQHIKKVMDYKGFKKGSRTIYMMLPGMCGVHFGRAKILRLMKKYGCVCTVRKERPESKTSKENLKNNRKPNLLRRRFRLARPNEILLTDVSYLKYSTNKTEYFSCIKDAVTGRIVNHVTSSTNNLSLATDTIACLNSTESALFHSDQGVLYFNESFQNKLKSLGYEQSMSRRGNCWDNSSQESYFGHMKDECDFSKCSTPKDVKRMVDEYVYYYNYERPQWSRDKMTPVDYENYLNSMSDGEYSEYMEIEQEKYDKMMEKAGIKALKRAVELGAFTQEKLELWLK
ncbi:IS3 family transposase [uncultured Holdemanella sp.]|uniref:IS3 family transposase n=1 Tax=uncultured Holdemanella sp. TaxID=1763549 RepID=UPI00258EBBE1|nr:IS3 family transposase [uncultured Holdemanella sp.]